MRIRDTVIQRRCCGGDERSMRYEVVKVIRERAVMVMRCTYDQEEVKDTQTVEDTARSVRVLT
jgi:hypothetical protein